MDDMQEITEDFLIEAFEMVDQLDQDHQLGHLGFLP